MALPSDSDYQSALQHPGQAFSDARLKAGVVEQGTGVMAGLPRPRAGNFATTYKVTCGDTVYAVRCFTRPYPRDQESRYLEIRRHLEQHWLPSSVGVWFQPRGIHVRGRWLPLVMMEWVQGESLERYVGRHLREPLTLFRLAAEWLGLLSALRDAGIAHGDLQHGNVLVTERGLRLIDYDGMCVPPLVGRKGHETGHPNYQHPGRDAGFFDLRLDHFSGWVVWLSLVALAHEPSLWERFQGGDDCLLFRRRDFLEPERSPLFQALRTSPHARVREYVAPTLSRLLAMPADAVPEVTPAASPPKASEREASPTMAWLRELSRFLPLETPVVRQFSREGSLERGMVSGLLVTAALGLVPAVVFSPWWLVGAGFVGSVGAVRSRALYLRDELARERLGWERQRTEAATARVRLEEQLRRLTGSRPAIARESQAARSPLLTEQDALHAWMEDVRSRNLDVDSSELERIEGRRAQVDREELNARKDLEVERRRWEDDAELQRGLSAIARSDALRGFKQRMDALEARFDERRAALEAEEDAAALQARTSGVLSRAYREAMARAAALIDLLRMQESALVEVDRALSQTRHDLIVEGSRESVAECALAAYGSSQFSHFLAWLFQETPDKP
ncbi:hypothetical protein LXT21_26255 [Myxococcus sp. K38C18041901]|uniref:hypothetical protein n=1 Tax=Myxococcus guangdongensis TaxID=2906760 RepID=UPI0020A7A5B3|nr:hypothetical protein [Myxococcus guangdongensis]MCP3062298.1 hypothetical protein [Myxococcus guangdongensis]